MSLPVTLNGRVQAATDVDSYRFAAKAGQKLVAAVMAHALDIHGQYRTTASPMRSSNSSTPRESRRGSAGHAGTRSRHCVHRSRRRRVHGPRATDGLPRLSAGRVPAHGGRGADPVRRVSRRRPPRRIGQRAALRLERRRQRAAARRPDHPTSPYAWATVGGDLDSGRDVPLHIADVPAAVEQEPNDERTQATPLGLSTTMNGRFENERDDDWYRLELSSTQPVWLETFAHRHLKAPVDTVIHIYDADGNCCRKPTTA